MKTTLRDKRPVGRPPSGYNQEQVKALTEWLERKFLERQNAYRPVGRLDRYTLDDFARDINIKGGTIGHWMRGIRVPGELSVRQLAIALGYEIYDILGLQRPDQNWELVESEWDRLTPEVQAEIARLILAELERQRSGHGEHAKAGTTGGVGAAKRRGKG